MVLDGHFWKVRGYCMVFTLFVTACLFITFLQTPLLYQNIYDLSIVSVMTSQDIVHDFGTLIRE